MPRTPQNADLESSDHKKQQNRRFDPLATSSRKQFRGLEHSNLSSEPVPPQDSSADLRSYERTEHPDIVLPSLPSTSGAIKQSIGATLEDAHHFSTDGNTRIVTADQHNVNSWGTEHVDPVLHSDRFNTRAAMFEKAHNFHIENAPITNIGQQHNHQHVNINHGNHGPYSNSSSSNVRIQSSQGLDSLKEFVSFSALHDSSAQDPERCCHPGTRKNVLHNVRTWMDDPNAPEQILWLHGPAGVGKSAIAQTISYSYGRDKVGASFFFFRSDPTRNDGNRLFPTLAWRLASSAPVVKNHIAFFLEEDPDLPRKAIEIQFQQLIAQPFLTISGGESATPRTLSPVIIIDGLDECSDVKLQRRILKIIGNAVANTSFPPRFIISSRPEAHIEDFFSKFEHPTLQIDLANIDDAFRDIETYLTSEFARIAVEQELDPEVWPGQRIIDTLVSRSSGQFVYASTIIKYADDEYESAVAQLNIILGLKLCTGKSPFAELDALYTEILLRQPDQDFLKEFLAILVACSGLSQKNLHEDYAMLLGLDEKELDRKLRGMHSLLKCKPFIDIHHKSFLDFLQDLSRSSEYHVEKHFANRRYMEMITDVLVMAASTAMKQPDSHECDLFQPIFASVIKCNPFPIELPLNDLEEILRPLLIIQENLLQLPNMSVPWKPRACKECWTFYIIDDLLLHLALFRGQTQLQEPKYAGIRPLTAMEERQSIPQLDLDACLSLLLANLRGVELLLNVDTIGLVRALVRFDPIETAMKIRSMTDAQNVVDLIFCLNKKECFKSWFGAAAHNATRLALAIYGRIPLLPRSLFLNSAELEMVGDTYQGKAVKMWVIEGPVSRDCFDAFVWRSLFHGNMGTSLGICSVQWGWVEVLASPESGSAVQEWRQSNNPSMSKIQQIIFEVAKAIQYLHSLGIVPDYHFVEDDVYVDSDNHVKILCPGFCPNDLCKEQFDYYDYYRNSSSSEGNIHFFALLFYQVLFNNKVNSLPETRPSEPEIPDNVWQLMQWCRAKDPNKRPTIDEVVQEMESWISLGQFTLST